MNDFLNINKTEIRKAFVFSFVFCLGFTLLLLVFPISNNQVLKNNLLDKILIVGALGFPLFITLIVIVIALLKIKYDTKIYAKLDTLSSNNISVKKDYAFKDFKWFFTEETRTLIIDGQQVFCYIYPFEPSKVYFEMTSPRNRHKTKMLKKKKIKKLTKEQLKTELISFVNEL